MFRFQPSSTGLRYQALMSSASKLPLTLRQPSKAPHLPAAVGPGGLGAALQCRIEFALRRPADGGNVVVRDGGKARLQVIDHGGAVAEPADAEFLANGQNDAHHLARVLLGTLDL